MNPSAVLPVTVLALTGLVETVLRIIVLLVLVISIIGIIMVIDEGNLSEILQPKSFELIERMVS